ncbi:MAG: magnesium/cobalt transporter CorA, partial [Deltaproteobacteria bacterium]|nr:magnesium/cobalt transporter CorA [Deltaproteobacteria bacterium]
LAPLLTDHRTVWIDVQGIGDEAMLRELGELFSIHPLALEDVVNSPQRPKVEEYGDQLLIIARMAREPDRGSIDVEQVGLFVGRHYVITVQERYGDVLDPVRVRLRENKGPIRSAGSGYLAYAIVDTIVDGYYPVIEEINDRLLRLETRVLEHPTPRTLAQLNTVKAQLAQLQRALFPKREALARLVRESYPAISDEVRVYLRDTLDHCAQLVDALDSQRELVNALLNTHLAVIGARTNEVMKMLTIMASIFIPLTFLAGLYGMNFPDMFVLDTSWAYPTLLGVMALIVVSMLLFFRRRGWLGKGEEDDDDDG